jgi:hypothetical protein
MQGFQGYGYSEEFSENMTKVINFIKNNPEESIEIIAKCDSICSACPNKNPAKKICIKKENERIKKEKKLAEFLNIELDKTYKIVPLFNLVNQKISSKKTAKKIYCGGCLWYEKCLWYQSKK